MGFNDRKKKLREHTTKSSLTKGKAKDFLMDDEVPPPEKKSKVTPAKKAKSKYETEVTLHRTHTPDAKGTKVLRQSKDLKAKVKAKLETQVEIENKDIPKSKAKAKSKHETIFTMRQASDPKKKPAQRGKKQSR